ncbi:MAG: glycoside hydrolase [Acidobacteriota bacterium]|nr:glycoside hydrolase [Acidobacteriota bacterium]
MLIPVLLAALVMIDTPAATGSAEPHVASLRDGGVVLSWLEPAGGKKHALKVASYRKGKWSAPRVIAARDDFFVNWADFPSVVEDRKGTLFAHWLQKSGSDTYAYDVWITASRDDGKTWKTPRVLHTDRKPGEHGFVSIVPLAAGGVAVAWLDSREMKPGSHHGHGGGAMTLQYAEVDGALHVSRETLLDARVCECCATGMAMTVNGPLVVYRDRSNEEIRDISFVRKNGAAWTTPARVHADGWKIEGCPVNGPQADARGKNVAVAWFTAPENKPIVNVAFSRDAGATFGKALRIDSANAAGRVDLLMLDDGSALVTWIEGTADNSSIMMRRVYSDGRMAAPQKLAATTSARGAGFPRAALTGKTAWFAWTDLAAKKIRVAKME